MSRAAATILPPAFRPRAAHEPLRISSRAVNALCFGLRSLARSG